VAANPYSILDIGKEASNQEIIRAAALQMRQKRFCAKEIAQAQKMLLDPVSRGCQEFLYHFDFKGLEERLCRPLEIKPPEFDAPCLTLFDNQTHDC